MAHWIEDLLWEKEGNDRLEQILCSWRGTPWMRGQRVKRVGVDCLRFALAVWDEWLGRDPCVPRDMSFETPAKFRAAFRFCRENYPCHRVRDRRHGDNTLRVVQPGDIIFADGRSEYHLMVVGTKQGELWHAQDPFVDRTSISFMRVIHVIYRLNH